MATLSWSYVPSKSGKPRYAQIDKDELYKKGWEKIPETYDLKKPVILIHEYKWSELTSVQTTGIYNHTLLYACNIAGDNTIGPGLKDQNRYIIQDQKGYFTIKYNGGSFDLFINTGTSDQHIIRNRPLKSPVKMVTWLKRYAQYLIDEPEQLQKIIDNPVLIDNQGLFEKSALETIKEKPEYKPEIPAQVIPAGFISWLNLTITEERCTA
jgi:hypothetical protein